MDTTKPKPLTTVLVAGLAFGVMLGLAFAAYTGRTGDALHVGFLGGALFALALARFFKIALDTPRLEMNGQAAGFDPGERVLHWGPANHFKGLEAVGGRLYLTDRRLRFRSHKLNVQTHDASYELSAVVRVEPSRTLGIVPNGLVVHLADGRRERFVVQGRADWMDALRPRVSAHARPAAEVEPPVSARPSA